MRSLHAQPAGRRGRWHHPLAAAGAALLLALAGCFGSGSDDEDTLQPASSLQVSDAAPLVRNPGQGLARLGALQGATVEVHDLHTDAPIHSTTTDAQGRFRIDLGSHPLDALYRVTVRGGSDADFDNQGTAGQAAVASTSTLTAIASGRQIAERGVTVSLLSDLLARRVDDGILWNPAELVLRELNQAATHLFQHDVDGDGVVDYRDVLAFDPLRADHRGWLKFDWQVLYQKNTQGLSVMDMAHASHPALADTLLALLGNAIDINLPDEDQSTLVSLRFDVEGHGSLQSDLLPAVLDHDSSRYALAVARSPTDVVLVRATPAAGSRLLAWEGCTVDATDPLLCRATPDATKSVVAVFQDPDRPAANTSVLHLGASGTTPVGLVLHRDEAVITAVAGDATVARLDAALARLAADASHRVFVGADLARLSTLRITGLASRSETDGVVRYVVGWAPALVTDALESGSAYAPPAPISVDTISALTISGTDNASTPLVPANEANADDQPGPNPVDPGLDGALCGSGKTQHRLVDGGLACIAGSNLPVQSGQGLVHACAAGEVLVEVLDGEQFCVLPSDVHARAEETALRAAAGGVRTLGYAAARSGRQALQVLQQPVATSSAPLALRPGEVVWLVGHGKAIHLSRNVFMVDRPDGKGVRMVTVDGATTSVDAGSRAPMAFQQCMRTADAPECGFFRRTQMNILREAGPGKTALGAKTPQVELLPQIDFVITPEKYRWVTFSFRINADLTGTASANFDFGVLWYAFGSRGRIEVQPVFNTSVTADGLAMYKRPAGSTSTGDREVIDTAAQLRSGEPVFEKDLFRVDFLQKIPGAATTVSPVLESALRFAIGVDAAGQAKIEIETSFRQVVAWDVQSEFTYYVFKSNHNLQSFKVAARGYPGLKLKVDANGAIGMYAKAAVSMGPRGVMPELATLHARYYLYKLEALGKLLLSYQTDPARVEDQHGQNFCWAGAVSMTLKRSFDVTAKIDMKPSGFLGDVLKYVPLPRWEWTLYSWDGVLLNVGTKRGGVDDDNAFGADTDMLGASLGNAADVNASSHLECPPPSPASMPAEREFPRQTFKLEAGHSIYTRTHEFTMQRDGNFVVYHWNGTRGAPVWSTGTNGKARVDGYNQMLFQDDGNLVVYDLVGNPLWASSTYRVGGNAVRLTAAGAVEVWSRNAMLWSSATGPNRQLPASLSFKPGELVLAPGDGLVVGNRSLYLDRGGVFRWVRMQDSHEASQAWTYCANNCYRIAFQPNGNLEMIDRNGAVAYQTVTGNKGVTELRLEANGRFVLMAGSKAIWATVP